MALPVNLTSNEVKDAAGTEIEFLSWDANGRMVTYAKSGESPALPHRLIVSHTEVGSGIKLRRRSAVRVNMTHASDVDASLLVTSSFYVVGDVPIGAITALTNPTKCLANLISFVASKGATTTILYDCTGYGAEALLNGSLR